MTIANSVFNRHRNHGGNLIAAIAEARELLLGRAFERTREAIEDIEARRPDCEG